METGQRRPWKAVEAGGAWEIAHLLEWGVGMLALELCDALAVDLLAEILPLEGLVGRRACGAWHQGR